MAYNIGFFNATDNRFTGKIKTLVLRTEEGLIIDVYRDETNDCLAKMAIENPSLKE